MRTLSTLRFLAFPTWLLILSTTFATSLVSQAPQANCKDCQPNPIAATYPNNVTGTINGTISVVLVQLPVARALLPTHLSNSILVDSYSRSFKIHPKWYPIILETVIDHDIRSMGVNVVSDFSSVRITYPFIDLLGDGYTSFRYTSYTLLPSTNPIAIAGAQAYGEIVIPSTFDPSDAGYKYKSLVDKTFTFKSYMGADQSLNQPPIASVDFSDIPNVPYGLAFYKNVTNQPQFGNNTKVCDNMISFWNTSVSKGEFVPRGVSGTVELSPPLLLEKKIQQEFSGIRAMRAFLENNLVPCSNLEGYKGTGPGDSG